MTTMARIDSDHTADSGPHRATQDGWTGPMDLLALDEIAELLGETEASILAACDAFPHLVPMVGVGLHRRFPSLALDVLRLITDASASGVIVAEIAALVDANIAPFVGATGQSVAFAENSEPSPPALDPRASTLTFDSDALASDLAAVRADVALLRADVAEVRAHSEQSARADDIERLRIEARGLATLRSSPVPAPPTVPLELLADIEDIRDHVVSALGAIGVIDVELKRQATSTLAGLDGLRQVIQSHWTPSHSVIAEVKEAVALLRRDLSAIRAVPDVESPDLLTKLAPTLQAVDTTARSVHELRNEVALLRVQHAQAAIAPRPDYQAELRRELGPALDSLGASAEALQSLRAEVADLRAMQARQNGRDGAAEIAQLAGEIALLRTSMETMRERIAELDRSTVPSAPPSSQPTTESISSIQVNDSTSSARTEIPTTIIGDALPRVPRRMGRARSHDER